MADERTAADLENGTEVDTALFEDTEEMPYAKLMEMLKDTDDDGDDVAFGRGEEKPAPKDSPLVSVEDGVDLIDKATRAGEKAAKVEADKPAPEAQAAPEEKPAIAEEAPPAEGQDSQPDEIAALLDGLPDDRKASVRERIGAADEVLGIFKGREDALKRHGAKPADVVKRLVDLSDYAEKNPQDYLAWAAGQFGNAAEVIGKAAEKLGLKVVAAEPSPEDDPFEDPQVKEMRQQLAAYKAKEAAALQIGPDSPQAKAQAELSRLAATLPHWTKVAPQIAALTQAHASGGATPTLDDIKRFYEAAVVASGITPPPQPAPPVPTTPAAQPVAPVAQQAATNTAADKERQERARKASMSLDGSGQGAGRRSDLDPDASIHAVLASLYKEQARG